MLSLEMADSDAAHAAFLQEAVTTSALEHPNIVKVFSRGQTDDDRPWIAMEYVAGTDAETALRANTMTSPRALHIITEVARASDYAHLRGVIHQDIKPANFLLGDQGVGPERVVLGDFGAALRLNDTLNRVDVDGFMVASFASSRAVTTAVSKPRGSDARRQPATAPLCQRNLNLSSRMQVPQQGSHRRHGRFADEMFRSWQATSNS